MAKTKAADRAVRDSDQGVESAHTPGGGEQPKLLVKILDDVEGFVEGKPVKPGDVVELDVGTATNLMLIGHGEITGTAKKAKSK